MDRRCTSTRRKFLQVTSQIKRVQGLQGKLTVVDVFDVDFHVSFAGEGSNTAFEAASVRADVWNLIVLRMISRLVRS